MLGPLDLAMQQVVVVGDGRIGRAFAQMVGPRRLVILGFLGFGLRWLPDFSCDPYMCISSARLVKRGQVVVTEENGNASYPIIVATHCSDLDAVLGKTCESKRKDLVFAQNGMLQPWLKQHGLQDNTQVLLFMSAYPENPLEPKGRMHIQHGGRDSCAWGRWADAIAYVMKKGGLQCSVLSQENFLNVMIEKLLWSSIFWLLSYALGGLPVGEIAQSHRVFVQELTSELLPLALTGVDHPQSDGSGASCHGLAELEMVERLCAYSTAISNAVPSKDVALSEFNWRNGWFLSLSITPCHLKWLKAAGIDCALS